MRNIFHLQHPIKGEARFGQKVCEEFIDRYIISFSLRVIVLDLLSTSCCASRSLSSFHSARLGFGICTEQPAYGLII